MKIQEIYIDGYKNIVNTHLLFEKSMIALLSRNNYGKTNVLSGIKEGFKFLSGDNMFAAEYIEKKPYRDAFNKKNSKFTFGIKFLLSDAICKTYHYRFSIGNIGNQYQYGICEEELSFITVNDAESCLLKRDTQNIGDVFLYNVEDNNDFSLFCAYDSLSLLYLRAFSEAPMHKSDNDTLGVFTNTLTEIRNVFKSLTEKSIGKFIIDETTSCKDFSTIAQKISHSNEYYADKLKKLNNYFVNLYFHQYKEVIIEEFVGEPHLIFMRKEDNKKETIETLSFGTRRVLRILCEVIINESPLIFIEELENGIHPKMFIDVMNKLYNIVNDSENQTRLIVTSHSVSLVNLFSFNLQLIHFGFKESLAYKNQNHTKVRFARFSKDGISKINKEMKRIMSITNVGEFIYDYEDVPKLQKKLRSWLER
ncbi:MAG: ATP-binding protein [Firmicutes bacterium]|nr:ATP-binding protein [Bacillota bacterium]